MLDKNQEEIDLKQTFDDDEETVMVDANDFEYVADEKELDGSYITEEPEEGSDDDDIYGDDDYGDEEDFPEEDFMGEDDSDE